MLFSVRPEKKSKYYVCRLAVRDLNRLGLTVIADPDSEDVPGHCLIPELSRSSYEREYERCAEVGHELAVLGGATLCSDRRCSPAKKKQSYRVTPAARHRLRAGGPTVPAKPRKSARNLSPTEQSGWAQLGRQLDPAQWPKASPPITAGLAVAA